MARSTLSTVHVSAAVPGLCDLGCAGAADLRDAALEVVSLSGSVEEAFLAVHALLVIGKSPGSWVIGPLRGALKDLSELKMVRVEHRSIATSVIELLTSLHAAAGPEVFSALRVALKIRDPTCRHFTVKALSSTITEDQFSHGEAATTALIDVFRAALNDPDKVVRRAAADAAGNLGMAMRSLDAPSVKDSGVDALRVALEDHDDSVRCHAAEALGKLGAACSLLDVSITLDVVDALRCALEDPGVRVSAAKALVVLNADLGSPDAGIAKSVADALRAALEDFVLRSRHFATIAC